MKECTITLRFEDNREFTLEDVSDEVLAYIGTLEVDMPITIVLGDKGE